jgi:hypothetical protein
MKELVGAAVTIEARTLRVDVDALRQYVNRVRDRVAVRVKDHQQALADADIERPAVGVRGVDDVRAATAVDAGTIALKEILEHADSGTAVVTIPLHPQTLRAGPLSLAIEAGTAVVLDLTVTPGGVIERTTTRGRLEPALKLPLGASVQGISLDEGGAIVANIDRFPDVNLSMLALSGFVVPAQLSELVAVIFADRPPRDPADPSLVDVDGIVVVANDVVPRDTTLVVGSALHIRSGPKTRLNVRYGHGQLQIDGVVDIAHATIRASAFDINDVSGRCHVSADLDLGGSGAFTLDVDALDVDVAHAHAALVGEDAADATSDVALGAVSVVGAAVHVDRAAKSDDGADSPAPNFQVRCPELRGRILEGRVELTVGAMQVPVVLRPGSAAGSVTLANNHHQIDLVVEDAGVVVGPVDINTPIARIRVERAEASGGGRLRAASDGVAFSGTLATTVVVGKGGVDVGPAALRCERGEGTLTLTELSASAAGLEVLRTSADLQLVLGAGSVPVLGTRLVLEAGASARLSVDHVDYAVGAPPSASGRLRIDAAGERCVIDEALLVVPRSQALLVIERCTLQSGELTLKGLKAQVRTDDRLPEEQLLL